MKRMMFLAVIICVVFAVPAMASPPVAPPGRIASPDDFSVNGREVVTQTATPTERWWERGGHFRHFRDVQRWISWEDMLDYFLRLRG